MNAPVKDLELTFLERIFEHEAKCESKHSIWWDTCSTEVTHLFSGHTVVKKVCLVAASRIENAGDSVACARCGKYVSECWTIRPI